MAHSPSPCVLAAWNLSHVSSVVGGFRFGSTFGFFRFKLFYKHTHTEDLTPQAFSVYLFFFYFLRDWGSNSEPGTERITGVH
jgi:hypothetical protein